MHEEDFTEDTGRPSKTKQKEAMHELRDLGAELVELSVGQLKRINLPDDVPIEAKMVTRAIKSAQTQVEQQNFEVRKNVLKYDEVMNQQRTVIYDERKRILDLFKN